MRYLDNRSIPNIYNLFFDIDINNNIYDGYNKIDLTIIKNTKMIQFHALDINITKIIFNNIEIDRSKITYDINNEIYTIYFDDILSINKYRLEIYFSGKIGKGKSIVNDSETIHTEFEPNFAHRCFPCWDEPNIKTKYNMMIKINDTKRHILFNTDQKEIIINDGYKIYTFNETIPMSTYLMAFIICDYKFIEGYTNDNKRIRIYIPTDKSDECGRFALDTTIKCVNMMTNYYNESFPYNKIDLVPLINTDVGGMENYGLIFFADNYLLYDKLTTTLNDKIKIALVVVHELAHQWFGNIITISTWDELWLKESFATFFEYYITDKIYPTWDIETEFVYKNLETFNIDAIASKAIRMTIKNIKSIKQNYDRIVYYKGATLLFALLKYVGDEKFKAIIRNYVANYKYECINAASFINMFIENINENNEQIKNMIYSFINVAGIPFITINNNNINVSQLNIYDYIIKHKTLSNDIIVPILSNKNFIIVDNNNNKNITISNNDNIVNNKKICYYMICYDDKSLKILFKRFNNISSQEHISILYDLYTLGCMSLIRFDYWIIYLHELILLLLSYNDKSQYNYNVLLYIEQIIDDIKKICKTETNINSYYERKIIDPYKQLISKIFDIYNIELRINDDLYNADMNEINIILFVLNSEIDKSYNIIKSLIINKKFNISRDINDIIFKYIIRQNIISDNDYIIKIMKNKHLSASIISALKYTTDKKLLDNILNNINLLQYNDISDMIGYNDYFLEKCTLLFLNNHNEIAKIAPVDTSGYTKILNEIIINQTNEDIIKKILLKIDKINNADFDIQIEKSRKTLFCNLYKNNIFIETSRKFT